MLSYRYVDTNEALDDILTALENEPRFALDTEFHRERTYWPQVALIQLAWPGDLALIDPLSTNISALATLLDSDKLVVAHAASQDLMVLDHCCGTMPRHLFDTQIAAGFVGGGVPSLSSMYERELGLRTHKDHQLTDWLARPLGEPQLQYAAGDVAHLLEVHDRLATRLDLRGRQDWAEEEFKILLDRTRRMGRPEDAWTKVKRIRKLRGKSLQVARSLASWRERRAAAVNKPVRHVISDMVIVAIAQASPHTVAELARVRGVGKSMASGRLGSHILKAVKEGITSDFPPPARAKPSPALKRLLPAVSLVMAWVQQLAREHQIAPSLLATRADIEALIRGDADARLSRGWRAEMVGEPLHCLVAGDAALAFDGDGLVLEYRSRKRVL